MRNDGIIIIVGALALAGLLFAVWLLGLVLGFIVGGLIHLLLLLAVLIVPAGIGAGVGKTKPNSRHSGPRARRRASTIVM